MIRREEPDYDRRGRPFLGPAGALVLLVALAVIGAVAVGYGLTQMRSQAAGRAQQLYYAGAAYLVDCASGRAEFAEQTTGDEVILSDPEVLAPYLDAPPTEPFELVISRQERQALLARCTHRADLILGYFLEVTACFPPGSDPAGGLTLGRAP